MLIDVPSTNPAPGGVIGRYIFHVDFAFDLCVEVSNSPLGRFLSIRVDESIASIDEFLYILLLNRNNWIL